MNLLDVFRRSKKASSPDYLGRMWACVVRYRPWNAPGRRYDVSVKNVGIVEASAFAGETRVTSDEQSRFGDDNPVRLAGPVGRLGYVNQANRWIGFFETEDEAKEGYRRFADDLLSEIKSASARLGLPGETGKTPAA